MREPQSIVPPTSSTCWAALASDGPYYVAVEWRRGEPAPTMAAHADALRLARCEFARIRQERGVQNLDGAACLVQVRADTRWVALWARDGWRPEGHSAYTH